VKNKIKILMRFYRKVSGLIGYVFLGRYIMPLNFIVPYKIDKSLADFSHKDYSGLYFPKPKRRHQLITQVKNIVFKKDTNFEALLDNMCASLPLEYRKSFLRSLREYLEPDFDHRVYAVFSKAERLRRRNVLEYLRSKAESLQKEDINPYTWRKEIGAKSGSTVRFVEWVLHGLSSNDLKIDNEKEFATWLAKKVNFDLGESYNTTKARIRGGEDKVPIEKLTSYKLIESIEGVRFLKERKKNNGKK
jgi:hypothetical protein